MNLTKEEFGYLIELVESRIIELKDFKFSTLNKIEKSAVIKMNESVIKKLRVLQKESERLENAKKRKCQEQIQKNTTKIFG